MHNLAALNSKARMSRLTAAGYLENGKFNNHFSTSYKYDIMGNILTLRREGLLDSGDYGTIDDLTYSYEGNQVVKIDDAADESPSTAEQCTSAMPPMKRRSINTMPTAIC